MLLLIPTYDKKMAKQRMLFRSLNLIKLWFEYYNHPMMDKLYNGYWIVSEVRVCVHSRLGSLCDFSTSKDA